jgi:hypothetical protein
VTLVLPADLGELRSTSLRTKRDVLAVFVRWPSGRVVLASLAALVIARLLVGDWGRGDVAALVGIVVLVGPVEWFLHLFVLHASPDAWTARRLGLGSGHRQHHLDPPLLKWLLLPGLDAGIFVVLLAIVHVAWTVPLAIVVDAPVIATWLTATVLSTAALAHYEWVHLLVHTAYRPTSRYYARLARNHRRHHYRNEKYWLGVTTNSGDRLMRTYPRAEESVERSATARTLGRAEDGSIESQP